MLRDDRLRSKKDDLARVISSRKRKLRELYYATVHFPPAATDKDGDHQHDSSLAEYRQKELRFLDANDITRGCFFDESTLPPQLETAAVRPAAQSVVSEISQVSQGQVVVDEGINPPPYSQMPESATLSARHVSSSSNSSISLAVTRPQSPNVSTLPPTSISQAHPSQAPLRVDSSLSVQDVQVKQHSSPISEVSPNVADQHPTSPSSSVTSLTAHTAAASPSKDVLPTESQQPVPRPRVSEPSAQPSATAISSDKQVTVIRDTISEVQGQQQPPLSLKRETIEADAQTELARITPHSAVAESAATEKTTAAAATAPAPAVAPAPSAATPSDQTASRPSIPQAEKPRGPNLGRRAASPTRPVERMTTRVSSGAIRHKSVSEILGEKPKAQAPGATKEPKELKESAIGSPRWRANERQKKEKERSKLSTVIFPKQSPQKGRYQGFQPRNQLAKRADGAAVASRHGLPSQQGTANEENDYLFTLFQAKAHLPPRSIHLNILLSTAHKILTTSDHFVDYNEQMSCRTLKRLYQLQSANRWPLRQLQRAREPKRQPCHWDVLIDHAKWMSTDFKEERKWKIAVAKACAEWCKQYHEASPAEKLALRVNARIPPPVRRLTQSAINDTNQLSDMDTSSHPTPDLISSHEEDSIRDDMSEDPHPDLSEDHVPAAIFSLGCDKFTFNMERTAASDAILGELPLYMPVQMDSKEEMPLFQESPDSEWQTEILPVTKFAQGKLDLPPRGPPRKKSRYQYYDSDDEDEDNDSDRPSIPPERSGSALFDGEKINMGAAFRSPMEFPLPRQEFFDERSSSVWTPEEDEKLRRLVKEYSYNWSLVSSCLAHRSSQGWASPQCSSRTSSNFVSAAERRTPWECFERWTSLEPLPVDVARHPAYLKYRGMIDRSQQRITTVQQMAIQQHKTAGQPVPQSLLRHKTNVPVHVEQRHSTRHISSLDAIRKLFKKREAIAQKQQHTTQVASQRKINEICQPKPPLKTPQEWARLKQERDAKLHEQYKQTALAQQRAVMAQRLHAHSQQPHHQQLAQHAAAQIYQQQHGVLDQHGVPGVPIPLAPSSVPNAPHVPNAGIPMRTPANVPNGPVPRSNGGVPYPGVIPTPGGNHPHPSLSGAAPPGMSPAAAAALAAQQQRHLPAGAAAAMQASMAASSGSPDPSGLMMKMMPSGGMGVGNVNAMANRAAMASHTSPADSARILREASRLQEQQRLVQSKQQQQQNNSQPHHQFPHQSQPFLPQNALNRSPSLAVPKTANGTNRSSSMQGMNFSQAGRAGSPPFPPSASMGSHFGHSSASSVNSSLNPSQHATSPLFATSAPHANIPNAAAAFAQNLPNLNTLQVSIQRANPKLTPEQARKIAAEKVQQYHQQRMSQLALNGAVGNSNAMNAGSFVQHNAGMHAIHANQHPHGHPNGQIGMRNHVPPVRPHTSPANAAPGAPTMQKVPSQGHPPSQSSPSILSTTPHQAQGYSPLMRTVTTQAHAQVQPQRQFSPSYQQPQQQQPQQHPQPQPQPQSQHQHPQPQPPPPQSSTPAGPMPRPVQNPQPPAPTAPAASPHIARPQTVAGPAPAERAHSTTISTPPISATSPPSLPQPGQQQQPQPRPQQQQQQQSQQQQQQQQLRRSISNHTPAPAANPQAPGAVESSQNTPSNASQTPSQSQQRQSTGPTQSQTQT